MKQKIKEIFKIASLPVVLASLCCFSPIIIVLFGLGSVSVASTLANDLYGNYAWVFRLGGLGLLTVSVIMYLRRTKGICTLDEAKKRKREIINIVGIVFIVFVIGYVVFLYGVLELIGIFLKIW